MTPEEKAAFELRGRDIMTSLAIHLRQLGEWSAKFEVNGGQPVYGDTAANIVSWINNPLQQLVEGDQTMQDVIAKFRTDY